jgi:hypothetical protein
MRNGLCRPWRRRSIKKVRSFLPFLVILCFLPEALHEYAEDLKEEVSSGELTTARRFNVVLDTRETGLLPSNAKINGKNETRPRGAVIDLDQSKSSLNHVSTDPEVPICNPLLPRYFQY